MSQHAGKNDTHSRKIVSFRLGNEEYGVDILSVREIRGWTPTTVLPQAPHYVRGVINLRGAVLPVIDLGVRLGMSGTRDDSSNVIIVIEEDGRLIGLIVDAVSDILSLQEDQFLPTPEIPSTNIKDFIEGVATLDDRMIQLVATDQILGTAYESAA
ncbi:MAG: chemotaxis protein CheW [Pseudomonadota bacterium]